MITDKELFNEFLIKKVDKFEKEINDVFLFEEILSKGIVLADGN